MGNQLVGIAPSQLFPVEYYLSDIPDFVYDASLGSTRFFKVAKAKHKEGPTVVKVFTIPDASVVKGFPIADLLYALKVQRDLVEDIRPKLSTVPHCLPFQKALLMSKAAILVRQFVKDNLYDRISTRPFLNNIEKRWITFQLLQCLNQCHKLNICHGDIKLENIMITSWNWVLLTDFASYKPTYLPEDNPADFSYFFDTSRRRTCYIAPERFVKTLNPDLQNDQNSPATSLVLPDDEIRRGDLLPSMDVFSLGCAITELFTEGHAPFDFSQLLAYRSGEYSSWKVLEKIDDDNIRELVRSMMQKDPSQRQSIGEYLEQQRNKAFPEYFYTFLEGYGTGFATVPIRTPDEKVERLKKDLMSIVGKIKECENLQGHSGDNSPSPFSEGLVLIVPLLTSCLRALKHCTAKLNALEVLKTMAGYLSPDIILDRLLPYMIHLVRDRYPKVRASAFRTLTECLTLVKSLPRSDYNIFPEYILPNLADLAVDEAVVVRMAYAENIAVLAETALRFLEMAQISMEPDNDCTLPNDVQKNQHQISYDTELQTLQELIQQNVTVLLSDPANAVKETLVRNGITKLCVFFGQQKGHDVLLSHMITFLNDKEDRHLRATFFEGIVGVAAYVGFQCCPILKPLLQQGLSDSEEFVVGKALNAMAELTELGLIQKQMLYDLISDAIPLLSHPNLWIQQGAVGFVCAVARKLNLADVQCRLVPLLQPFLKHSIIQVHEELVLLDAVNEPLSRGLLDYLVRLPSLSSVVEILNERKIQRSITRPGHQPAYREIEDHLKCVFRRLQSDGMAEVVEDQIIAIKDHLIKVNKKKASAPDSRCSPGKDEGLIDLSSMGSPPPLHFVQLIGIEPPCEKQLRSTQRKSGKKKVSSLESPTVTMNEEWQHMFGSGETKCPPSPKLQHHLSDPSPLAQQKPLQPGKDDLLIRSSSPAPSEGKNSPSIQPVSDNRFSQNNCVPCQDELQSLIHRKQEEYASDEIIREASETVKEEKMLPSKWRPRGSLVAHLHEHRKAVNRIQVIPDTSLFATCSSDGCIKIWDCSRMEGANVANRSKQTYSRLDGPVSCLTTCQNMQSLAAASENGNIHVFRIATDSTKCMLFKNRKLDPIEEGSVVDMSYFDTGSQSVLAYGTIHGSIVGWDLRSPGNAWKLENNPRHGLVTSFSVDPHHCWLVLGTANGNMVCWDLRFQLPITAVSHPAGSRIRDMLIHPKKLSAVLASVQGNNEVSLWDMETHARIMTLWSSSAPPLSYTEPSDQAIHSMYMCSSESGPILLTGGSDMRVRYWDLNHPGNSFIVAGAATDPVNSPPANYRSRLIDGTEVVQEVPGSRPPTDNEDPPRRYPEVPPAGHHDCISGIAVMQTSQCFILSASRDGVVKVWK